MDKNFQITLWSGAEKVRLYFLQVNIQVHVVDTEAELVVLLAVMERDVYGVPWLVNISEEIA